MFRVSPLFYVLSLSLISLEPASSSDKVFVGHLKPFGQHREPDVITEELLAVPHPSEFWKTYVSQNRPVVFRGAAKHSRAYELWTEEFLISEYGNLTVRLEARAESNERAPVGDAGILGRDSIKHFIQNYQTMDAYVISQVPQPMERDIGIPPCLRCGSFSEAIQEVHLFLSARGGQTKLHQDPYSNIHCIFNGTKDWLLVHPDQTELVYMSDDSKFEWGGYSEIDIDSVDLEMFPKIKDVHYSKVTMNKGDCIFMPGDGATGQLLDKSTSKSIMGCQTRTGYFYFPIDGMLSYWHQVRSWGYMNSAVSIWFSQLKEFSDQGCDETKITFTPMDQVMVLWQYSGHGSLTQGHMDIHIIKRLLLTLADEEGKIWLNDFVAKFFDSESSKRDVMRKDEQDRARKLVEYLDPDGIGYVTQEYIQKLTIEQLKEVLLFIDPNDVSNTEEFEYSHIDAVDIENLLTQCHDERGNFDREKFISSYVEDLGGTLKKAAEIVENLGAHDKDVAISEIVGLIPQALNKFHSSKVHDPSFERKMYQHLHQHDEL